MLDVLAMKKRVICVDESWISDTEFSRKMWCPKNADATVTQKAVAPRLALIGSIDTDGRIYFALSHANTDGDTMSLFIVHLVRQLDVDIPDWRKDSVMLMDNASWHKSDVILKTLQDL